MSSNNSFEPLSRRRFVVAAGALAAVSAGLFAYAHWLEPTWLEITRHSMPLRHLPESLRGKLLAHLTDIHVGPDVSDGYILDVFRQVTALRPDIVVYTGDFTTLHNDVHDDVHTHAEQIYSRMPRGALGTFVSLGNHDYGHRWQAPEHAHRIASIMTRFGATVLRNTSVVCEGLTVVGVDDLWGRRFNARDALARVAADAPTIMLSHNPDTVDLDGWGNANGWILAGHTHGGQCKPPFLPPPLLPVRNRRYTSGEFMLQPGRTLYVSRGVGTVLPVRFNVRPEVALFTLERA
jgi:hypothetical protein